MKISESIILFNLQREATNKYLRESKVCRRNRNMFKRRKRFLLWIKKHHPILWDTLIYNNPETENIINEVVPDIKRYYPVFTKYN